MWPDFVYESQSVHRLAPGELLPSRFRCGFEQHNKELQLEQMKRTPEYALVYVMEGEGSYQVEGGIKERLEPGCCFQRRPDELHHLQLDAGMPKTMCFMAVPGPFYQGLLQSGLLVTDSVVLNPGVSEYWPQLLKKVFQSLQAAADHVRPESLQLALDYIMQIHQVSGVSLERFSSGETVLNQARRLLSLDLELNVSIPELLAPIKMSYSRLRQIFKAQTGQSAQAFRHQQRMRQAGRLIQETSCSFKEIAEIMHFPDSQSFSRSFKKVMGVTPTEFRALARET